jgi:hypothetical protein
MSLHIIVLDTDKRKIFAITDKRLGHGYCQFNRMVGWRRVHDNEEKIKTITKELYFIGGTVADMDDSFYNDILTVKHKKPSEIIDFAIKIDRENRPQFWKDKFNVAMIFGVYDDGRLFIWSGLRDGKQYIQFLKDKTLIDMAGGINNTLDRASEFMFNLMKENKDYVSILPKTVAYASSIDMVISPTYDFVTITERSPI